MCMEMKQWWVGICADDDQLAQRDLRVEDFYGPSEPDLAEIPTQKSATPPPAASVSPAVQAACNACPMQVECLGDAVAEIGSGLEVYGVRSGMTHTTIRNLGMSVILLNRETAERRIRQAHVRRELSQANPGPSPVSQAG